MALTAKQRAQRWWLEQKRKDLAHERAKLDKEIGEIDHALMRAPQAPSHIRDIKDKFNHEPPEMAKVDITETY